MEIRRVIVWCALVAVGASSACGDSESGGAAGSGGAAAGTPLACTSPVAVGGGGGSCVTCNEALDTLSNPAHLEFCNARAECRYNEVASCFCVRCAKECGDAPLCTTKNPMLKPECFDCAATALNSGPCVAAVKSCYGG